MSIENHPNFHAVKFAMDITASYYGSLRGKGKTCNICMDSVREASVKFVDEIEAIVDHEVEKTVGGQHND